MLGIEARDDKGHEVPAAVPELLAGNEDAEGSQCYGLEGRGWPAAFDPDLRADDGTLQGHAAPALQVLCQRGGGGPDVMRRRLEQWMRQPIRG